MGAASHMESYGFSADLNAYLRKVIEQDNHRTDESGKWLEKVTDKARRYDYWSKLIKDSRAMTTNDIQVLAAAFGISPFDWVENTKRHAAGRHTLPIVPKGSRTNVGPHPEDYELSEDPGDTLPNAAETRRTPGE